MFCHYCNIYVFSLIVAVAPPYEPNPNGAITVKNVRPKAWSGQLFDFRLSKGGSSILLQPDVHSGNQAVFILYPILKFAITRNLEIGETFLSLEISSDVFEVHLDNFPEGVEVILTEEPGGQAFVFKAVPLYYTK